MKKVRESNFELLRCILMFMIVLVHYNNSSMGKAFSYVVPGTINYYFVYFMESLAAIGTNGFVLLTGYFSWKKEECSFRKTIGLLCYVISYKVLFFILNLLILKTPFSMKEFVFSVIPNNWYITLYIVLIVLSPYLNGVIKFMSKKGFSLLLFLMFLLFSIWPTLLDVVGEILGIVPIGINTVALNGADDGYSIVNFVMLYFIGAFISKFNVLQHSLKWDVGGYLLCTCLIFIQEILFCDGWSYANPLVIISAVCFLNIFRKINVKSKWINQISKATLGVFLIHTQFLVCKVAWNNCGIKTACEGSIIELGWNMLLCCLLTYVFCTVLDMICRWFVKPISKWLDKISILNKNFINPQM